MALFPLFYCGNIAYYKALLQEESIWLERHEHFVKQTYRNRMEILGPNGIQKLVIPTEKTGSRRKVNDVRISYTENWQKDHWKSLEAAYRRSPYFEFYEDEFHSFFRSEFTTLWEFNFALFKTINALVGLDLKVQFTEEFEGSTAQLDYRQNDFRAMAETSSFKPYLQVFGDRTPFVPNLSILDALFNLGPQCADLVRP